MMGTEAQESTPNYSGREVQPASPAALASTFEPNELSLPTEASAASAEALRKCIASVKFQLDGGGAEFIKAMVMTVNDFKHHLDAMDHPHITGDAPEQQLQAHCESEEMHEDQEPGCPESSDIEDSAPRYDDDGMQYNIDISRPGNIVCTEVFEPLLDPRKKLGDPDVFLTPAGLAIRKDYMFLSLSREGGLLRGARMTTKGSRGIEGVGPSDHKKYLPILLKGSASGILRNSRGLEFDPLFAEGLLLAKDSMLCLQEENIALSSRMWPVSGRFTDESLATIHDAIINDAHTKALMRDFLRIAMRNSKQSEIPTESPATTVQTFDLSGTQPQKTETQALIQLAVSEEIAGHHRQELDDHYERGRDPDRADQESTQRHNDRYRDSRALNERRQHSQNRLREGQHLTVGNLAQYNARENNTDELPPKPVRRKEAAVYYNNFGARRSDLDSPAHGQATNSTRPSWVRRFGDLDTRSGTQHPRSSTARPRDEPERKRQKRDDGHNAYV